jgi:hypothetical protein
VTAAKKAKPAEPTWDKTLNIYQRKFKAFEDLATIEKSAKAAAGAGGYAYVEHNAVTRMVRPVLLMNGILPTFSVTSWSLSEKLITVDVDVTYINVDNPEDRQTVHGVGSSFCAKATGIAAATTFAGKNIIQRDFYMESTEPDVEAIPEPTTKTTKEPQADPWEKEDKPTPRRRSRR